MRSTAHLQSNDYQHAKKESNTLNQSSPSSSSRSSAACLKINKDSRVIKKSTPHPSSSPLNSGASLMKNNNNSKNNKKPQPQPQPQQQQRRPVIIYTHSPTVIQTNPKDFMSLVQKLTGLSSEREDDRQGSSLPPPPPPLQQQQQKEQQHHQQQQVKSLANNFEDNNNNNNGGGGGGNMGIIIDDNESASALTDETNNSGLSDLQVNSCYNIPSPMFDHPPNPCFVNNGIPFFNPNSADLLCPPQPYYNYSDSLFYMPNMRSSYSSSCLEGMKDLSDF